MDYIDGPARQTRLLVYTTASAIALDAHNDEAVVLDLDRLNPRRQPSPGAQKSSVAELLARTMAGVDAHIRAQTTPPARTSPAVLARRLVARGERTEVELGRERRYAPGPGFEALVSSALIEAELTAEKSQ